MKYHRINEFELAQRGVIAAFSYLSLKEEERKVSRAQRILAALILICVGGAFLL